MTTKRERILALADGTRTAREIAAEVGCHPVYVRVVVSRTGVAGRLTCQTKTERNRAMMALRQCGATYREIGKQFGVSHATAYQIISRGID